MAPSFSNEFNAQQLKNAGQNSIKRRLSLFVHVAAKDQHRIGGINCSLRWLEPALKSGKAYVLPVKEFRKRQREGASKHTQIKAHLLNDLHRPARSRLLHQYDDINAETAEYT
eukprot:1652326-Amphidinium_carterae.1